jgi:integrase
VRNRKQHGQIIRIGESWYVRYWELRNIGGNIERKRVTHLLGPITTRGKRPPADVEDEAEKHMATINRGSIPAGRILTVGDFVDRVYLPWSDQHKRPSTANGYRDIWANHLKPYRLAWLKDTRTYHVQGWLDEIGAKGLGRNTLKHIKSLVSGIFKLAKQQGYFQGENPARDTAINPDAPEPQETYAYTLDEINNILARLPGPARTAFAFAAYMGLRHGEIQGLLWENYCDGDMFISQSIWNGRIGKPKTRKSRAAVPVIRQLAELIEKHRARCGNPQSGPIFATSTGRAMSLGNLSKRVIRPALDRCAICKKSESKHKKADHVYKRDDSIPEWHGWQAARRGLATNLHHLHVPDIVIQRILRHSDVSVTDGFYIKAIPDDVRSAMTKLEDSITTREEAQSDTDGTPNDKQGAAGATDQTEDK